jgi:Ca-activated chloride channel homolog
MRRIAWVVMLGLGLAAGTPRASSQSVNSDGSAARADSPAQFRSGVDLVTLNVVVTDGQQHAITNLPQNAFEVYEDNVPQSVTYFASAAVPLDLAVLIDTSSSMINSMEALQEAAVRFLGIMRSGDRVTVIGVGNRARVLHPLNDDARGAAAAIRRVRANGTTALYDALYLSLSELQRQNEPGAVRRQVLTVFSDGEDTTSLMGFDAVLERVRRTGITTYTMLLRSADGPIPADMSRGDRARFAMKDVASESGGRAFFPTRMTQVPDLYSAIAEDINGQYTLGYVSTNTARDGRLRQVRVRMKDVPGAARTRTGYYADQSAWHWSVGNGNGVSGAER